MPPVAARADSRDRPAVAALPELDERRRQERQAAGTALDLVDQPLDQRRLDGESRTRGRTLDDRAVFVAAHRPDEDLAPCQLLRERRVFCAATIEIRAQGEDHGRSPGSTSGEQRPDERGPCAGVVDAREHLLELVDDHQQARALGQHRGGGDERVLPGRQHRPLRLVQGREHDPIELAHGLRAGPQDHAHPARVAEDAVLDRRHQPGPHRRRLAAARRTDHPEEAVLGESRGHLGHEALAPEEDVGIVDAERREADERADVPRLDEAEGRCRRPWPGRRMRLRHAVRHVERRVLAQDRALEILQGARRVEAELLRERPTDVPVGRQRLRLVARPVQRHHELAADALVQWMLPSQPLELVHDLGRAPEPEVGVDPTRASSRGGATRGATARRG